MEPLRTTGLRGEPQPGPRGSGSDSERCSCASSATGVTACYCLTSVGRPLNCEYGCVRTLEAGSESVKVDRMTQRGHPNQEVSVQRQLQRFARPFGADRNRIPGWDPCDSTPVDRPEV